MPNPVYYSLRNLSPYQGTVQVVELDGFRALSHDGITWRVRIRRGEGQRAVHGIWHNDGDNLPEALHAQPGFTALDQHPPTPFPLIDSLELWLLDANEGLPLALLQSLAADREPTRPLSANWVAAFRNDEDFYAPSLANAEFNGIQERPPISHAKVLTRCVRAEAGASPRAQWFRKTGDGYGEGLGGLDLKTGELGRLLELSAFPLLLVREQWETEIYQGLIADYHQWQAPSLLTHTDLPAKTREWLESAACQQAERLYAVRKLLPEMINKEKVEAVLVEAVIRRSVSVE